MHTFVAFCGIVGSTWGRLLEAHMREWEIQIICTKIRKNCLKTLTNCTHNSTTSRHRYTPPPPPPPKGNKTLMHTFVELLCKGGWQIARDAKWEIHIGSLT